MSHALSADGEDIVILGKDTEAAFYGVTLKMMFFFSTEINLSGRNSDYASIDKEVM